MKYPAKTDIAVLLLFFNRADTFRQVFDEVRKARPSKLLLYQDGPRGERDMSGIGECRKIVSDENIDYEESRLRPFWIPFPQMGFFHCRQGYRARR